MAKQILVLFLVSALLPAHYACADYSAGVKAYDAHDYSTALVQLKPEAANGNHIAQNLVGVIYMNALGVPKDDSEAMKWFRLAADQGYAVAQTNLGFLYANGRGVERSDSEARRWFENASAQGEPRAATYLALLAAKAPQQPVSLPSQNLPVFPPPNIKKPSVEENAKGADRTNATSAEHSPQPSQKWWSSKLIFGLLFGLIGYSIYEKYRKQSKKEKISHKKVETKRYSHATSVEKPHVIHNPVLGLLNFMGDAGNAIFSKDLHSLGNLFPNRVNIGLGKIPKCDVLFLYCELESSGRIVGQQVSLRDVIKAAGAHVAVVASEVRRDVMTSTEFRHFLTAKSNWPANIIITLNRSGDTFGQFFQKLFIQMLAGISMPLAWVKLAPQGPNIHVDCPGTIVLLEAGHIVFKPD